MAIDLEKIKLESDLLAIAGRDTDLKKVANTGGGEWAGPCPFCGGRDRFVVQPNTKPGRWLCRNCTAGKWHDAITYVALRDNLDPGKRGDLQEICTRLAPGALPMADHAPERTPAPAYAPPAADWQRTAAAVVDQCQETLWQPRYIKALEYLRGRGLADDTIRHFRLGYCASVGGDPQGYYRNIAGLWIPRGIVIPCSVGGEYWYIKIRLLPGVPCRCNECGAVLPTPGDCHRCGQSNKYRGVKGNRPAAIFNADAMAGAEMALFCEGEFDAMIAHQDLNDVIPCVTMGSATNRPDLATWGRYLLPLRYILAAYDTDQAGKAGAAGLAALSKRVKRVELPEGYKDINEYRQAGGELWPWLLNQLERIAPELLQDPIEA